MSGNDPDYLHNYLHLLGISILYYDYLLTFSDEYWSIWRRPKNIGAILFFVNRYLAILGDIAVNVGNFFPFTSTSSCSQYGFFRQILLILAQVIVCICLCLRTWALYSRNKGILALMVGSGCALLAVSCWAVVGQHETIDLNGGCHTAADHITAIHIAVAWESLFVYDVLIFFLTIYKTWQQRFRGPRSTSVGRYDLLSLIFRDGAMYFAVMASANLANTLTFYLLSPLLRGVLSTFASSISVTMMARLMLNLQKRAGTGEDFLTTTLSPSQQSPSMFFSSNIEVQPNADMQSGTMAAGYFDELDETTGDLSDFDCVSPIAPEEVELHDVVQVSRRKAENAGMEV